MPNNTIKKNNNKKMVQQLNAVKLRVAACG